MMLRRILTLSWVLLLLPFHQALANDRGQSNAKPNDPAVDLYVHMRLFLPPEKAAPSPGPGPSLTSKLGGFANSVRNGGVDKWITENPPRLTTVSATPPYAGETPRYSLVVLFSRNERWRPLRLAENGSCGAGAQR